MDPLSTIAGISGVCSVILFLLVVVASRKIGGDSSEDDNLGAVPTDSIFGILIIAGIFSIIKGVFRGEFKHRFELGLLIAFLVFAAIFGVSLWLLLRS